MLQLVLWIIACAVFSFCCVNRIQVSVVAVVVLRLSVPAVASELVTGSVEGIPSLHPSTWLVFSVLLFQLLRWPKQTVKIVEERKFVFLALASSVALIVVGNFLVQRALGLSLILNQLVAPLALFLLLHLSFALDHSNARRLRNLVLWITSLQVGLALLVYLRFVPQPFVNSFSSNAWYSADGFVRQMGTLDHPLTLSLLLVVSMAFLASLRRTSTQVVLSSWFMVGILLTQSRTGLALGVVVLTYLLLRSGVRPWARLATIVAFGIVASVYLSTTLSSGVSGRIADDNGSGDARLIAVDFFLSRFQDHLLTGTGTYSSYSLTASNGLVTSLENPLLMYAVDYGIVASLLYFSALIALAISVKHRPIQGAKVAALLALLVTQTYSSVATESAASAIVWIALALASANVKESRPEPNMSIGVIPSRLHGSPDRLPRA